MMLANAKSLKALKTYYNNILIGMPLRTLSSQFIVLLVIITSTISNATL